MGADYLGVIIAAIASAATAGTWVSRRGYERVNERIKNLNEKVDDDAEKINERVKELEAMSTRLPIEYVLKADYIRELQKMNLQFNQIQEKLDRLITSILSSRKADL
jgi:hypothetical protein